MKKIILALLMAGSISAMECERIAAVKIGDKFNTINNIETIKVDAEKEKMNLKADKYEINTYSINHSKLGKQYYSVVDYYKCSLITKWSE